MNIPDESAALLTRLSHPEGAVRQQAHEELTVLGTKAVLPLLKVYQLALAQESYQNLPTLQLALNDLALHLITDVMPERIAPLVLLVQELRTAIPRTAMIAAQGLHALALHQPTPALRQALPALKGNFLQQVPSEFSLIRATITQATALWKDLPLLANPPLTPEDLSIPTTNKSGDAPG